MLRKEILGASKKFRLTARANGFPSPQIIDERTGPPIAEKVISWFFSSGEKIQL